MKTTNRIDFKFYKRKDRQWWVLLSLPEHPKLNDEDYKIVATQLEGLGELSMYYLPDTYQMCGVGLVTPCSCDDFTTSDIALKQSYITGLWNLGVAKFKEFLAQKRLNNGRTRT
jgi:hypothetical protein